MLSCYRPGYRPVLGNIISVILSQKMLSCYRPVLGNIILVILSQKMLSCYRPVLGNIISVILGQSKCFLATDPATDRYWVTLF